MPLMPSRQGLDPRLALILPLAFAASLAMLGLVSSVRRYDVEIVTFWTAAGAPEGQGPLEGLAPAELYDRACRQGWADGCVRLAGVHFLATGGERDVPRALIALDRACTLRSTSACADLGVILQDGDGVASDPEKGRVYLKRACDGGFRAACNRLEGASPKPTGG